MQKSSGAGMSLSARATFRGKAAERRSLSGRTARPSMIPGNIAGAIESIGTSRNAARRRGLRYRDAILEWQASREAIS